MGNVSTGFEPGVKLFHGRIIQSTAYTLGIGIIRNLMTKIEYGISQDPTGTEGTAGIIRRRSDVRQTKTAT